MKIRLIVCCLCLIFVAGVSGCKKSDEPGKLNSFKRYSIKNVHAVFRHSGDSRGTEELFIADYGKYEARYSDIDMSQGPLMLPKKNTDLTRVSDHYLIDRLTRKIRHQRNLLIDSMFHLDESDVPLTAAFHESQMRDNFFKNEGTDTVAGLTATKWRQKENNMIYWVWNTITVKQRIPTQENFVGITLVSIDTNWVVDTTKFSLPSDGYEVMEFAPDENMQQR